MHHDVPLLLRFLSKLVLDILPAAFASLIGGFLFTMLDSLAMPSLLAVFWQFLVTALLFPFAHRLIDRFEDADVRFR